MESAVKAQSSIDAKQTSSSILHTDAELKVQTISTFTHVDADLLKHVQPVNSFVWPLTDNASKC